MVKSLEDLVAAIDNKSPSFLGKMTTSLRCTALAYGVSCAINAYLNTCIKASATASSLYLWGQTPASFQLIIADLDHGHYHGQPLPPSLRQLLQVRENERAADTSIPRHPPPPGGGGRSGGGGSTAAIGGGDTPVPLDPGRSSLEGDLVKTCTQSRASASSEWGVRPLPPNFRPCTSSSDSYT